MTERDDELPPRRTGDGEADVGVAPAWPPAARPVRRHRVLLIAAAFGIVGAAVFVGSRAQRSPANDTVTVGGDEAFHPARAAVAYLEGGSATIARGDGIVEARIALGQGSPGFEPHIAGAAGGRLVVGWRETVLVDVNGKRVSRLGRFAALGAVHDGGFWVASPPSSGGPPEDLDWIELRWDGSSTGAAITLPVAAIPFGAVASGLAAVDRATGHCLVATPGRTIDLGRALPVAATGDRVAVISDGRLILHELATGERHVLAETGSLVPAATVGAGSFSSGGDRIALLLKTTGRPPRTQTLLVVGVGGEDDPERVDVPSGARVEWVDRDRALVVSGDGTPFAISTVTTERTALSLPAARALVALPDRA